MLCSCFVGPLFWDTHVPTYSHAVMGLLVWDPNPNGLTPRRPLSLGA